jgi:hypothetical protein
MLYRRLKGEQKLSTYDAYAAHMVQLANHDMPPLLRITVLLHTRLLDGTRVVDALLQMYDAHHMDDRAPRITETSRTTDMTHRFVHEVLRRLTAGTGRYMALALFKGIVHPFSGEGDTVSVVLPGISLINTQLDDNPIMTSQQHAHARELLEQEIKLFGCFGVFFLFLISSLTNVARALEDGIAATRMRMRCRRTVRLARRMRLITLHGRRGWRLAGTLCGCRRR